MRVNIPRPSRQADNMTVTCSLDYSNVQGLSRVRITTLRSLYSTKELRPSLGYRFPLSLELPALIRNFERKRERERERERERGRRRRKKKKRRNMKASKTMPEARSIRKFFATDDDNDDRDEGNSLAARRNSG